MEINCKQLTNQRIFRQEDFTDRLLLKLNLPMTQRRRLVQHGLFYQSGPWSTLEKRNRTVCLVSWLRGALLWSLNFSVVGVGLLRIEGCHAILILSFMFQEYKSDEEMHSLIFRQMFEHMSSSYTYIVACRASREAVIIDPVIETLSRDATLIKQLHLKLKFAANTHVHADHVTGTGELRKIFPDCQTVIAACSKANADLRLCHGDTLHFGKENLQIRSTPGHTDGCITFVSHKHGFALTGDALLIRGCGRTDFQQGDPSVLFDKVHSEILSLPKDYLLYPAHDYRGMTCTSVEEELEHNPRLSKSKDQFLDIMNNLALPQPRQIEKSVPANMVCGVFELMDEKTQQLVQDAFKLDQAQKH